MAQVSIIPATDEHIREIVANVRPEDREELWVTALSTPEESIRRGVENSDQAMVGIVDGVAVCIWGVVNESLIGPIGTPWMVASAALDKHARAFIRRCRKEGMKSFEGYALLENYVHAKNVRAIEWLRFMGFSVSEEAEEYGMFGELFYRFELKGDSHV